MSPQPGAGRYAPMSYTYEDTYITNQTVQHQKLTRTVARPDITFTVQDMDFPHYVRMTGTSNWVNNGAASQQGPGVIQPPIEIAFNHIGPSAIFGSETYPAPYPPMNAYNMWASYDRSTNAPVVYPVSLGKAKSTKFYIWLEPGFFTGSPIIKYDGHS